MKIMCLFFKGKFINFSVFHLFGDDCFIQYLSLNMELQFLNFDLIFVKFAIFILFYIFQRFIQSTWSFTWTTFSQQASTCLKSCSIISRVNTFPTFCLWPSRSRSGSWRTNQNSNSRSCRKTCCWAEPCWLCRIFVPSATKREPSNSILSSKTTSRISWHRTFTYSMFSSLTYFYLFSGRFWFPGSLRGSQSPTREKRKDDPHSKRRVFFIVGAVLWGFSLFIFFLLYRILKIFDDVKNKFILKNSAKDKEKTKLNEIFDNLLKGFFLILSWSGFLGRGGEKVR